MEDEIVIKRDTKPKPGWPCPRCGGYGYNHDGMGAIGPDETRIRPPSKCYLCEGTGRVHCTPARAE